MTLLFLECVWDCETDVLTSECWNIGQHCDDCWSLMSVLQMTTEQLSCGLTHWADHLASELFQKVLPRCHFLSIASVHLISCSITTLGSRKGCLLLWAELPFLSGSYWRPYLFHYILQSLHLAWWFSGHVWPPAWYQKHACWSFWLYKIIVRVRESAVWQDTAWRWLNMKVLYK